MIVGDVRQCTVIKANRAFDATIDRRRIHVKEGDRFWVTSTSLYAANYGVVDIAREGKTTRYAFTLENFLNLFELVSQ